MMAMGEEFSFQTLKINQQILTDMNMKSTLKIQDQISH